MIDALEMARALLQRNALELRQMAMNAAEKPADLGGVREPNTLNEAELAAAASLIELLCERAGVHPPSWTSKAPSLKSPFYVVASAKRMPRLRVLCETQGPETLRKRGFLAPPEFLTFA